MIFQAFTSCRQCARVTGETNSSRGAEGAHRVVLPPERQRIDPDEGCSRDLGSTGPHYTATEMCFMHVQSGTSHDIPSVHQNLHWAEYTKIILSSGNIGNVQ